MDYALSELQAVLRGACRGVGAPAVLGDELAEAVAYAGPDFAHWDELRAVFETPLASILQDGDLPREITGPIRCLIDAPVIADALVVSDREIVLGDVDAPHILQLYLRRAGHLWECPLTCVGTGPWRCARGGVRLSEPTLARVVLPDGLYSHLSQIAARSFVPATEETRLSGAGAGLTDND